MYSGGWTVSLNGLLLDCHQTSHSSASRILAFACFLLRFCFVVPSQSGATRKRKPRARLARPRDRRLQAASRANKGRMRAACLLSICPHQPPNPCPAKQGLAPAAAVPPTPERSFFADGVGVCLGSGSLTGTKRANKRASFCIPTGVERPLAGASCDVMMSGVGRSMRLKMTRDEKPGDRIES